MAFEHAQRGGAQPGPCIFLLNVRVKRVSYAGFARHGECRDILGTRYVDADSAIG